METFDRLLKKAGVPEHMLNPAPLDVEAQGETDRVDSGNRTRGKTMAEKTVRGYTLTKQLIWDGSNMHLGVSPDGLPVCIRLTAERASDANEAESVLEWLGRYRQLRHPSLTPVRDAWVEGGHLVLVTDFLEGESLAGRRHNQGRFQARELVDLFLPVASAIDLLHHHGIRHRHIAPGNVLLGRDGPRLDVPRFPVRVLFGVVVGPYTAPEEARQEKESLRSDQYSLAAVYIDLRRGRILYSNDGDDFRVRLIALLERRDPDLAPLPDAEQRVLRKALAIDPDQRYPTCVAFLEDLDRVVDPRRSNENSGGSHRSGPT